MANVFSRLAGLVKGAARAAVSPRRERPVVFTDLAPEDHQRMERQRALVLAAAATLADVTAWTRTHADLLHLQRVLDDAIFDATQVLELSGVGVVFGDVLETELGLRWVAAMDDEGTFPVLNVRNTMCRWTSSRPCHSAWPRPNAWTCKPGWKPCAADCRAEETQGAPNTSVLFWPPKPAALASA
jgi:hypothetical protein